MQLQVKVNRLNKRKVIPAQLPEYTGIIGEVWLGFTFEGTEVPAADTPNPAMGIWYQDRDGYFYWGGGLEIMDTASLDSPAEARGFEPGAPVDIAQPAADSSKMSWGHTLYDIPFLWSDLDTQGEGVTIAVLDTGIDTAHDDLKDCIHPSSRSFVGDPDNIMDEDGHGTRMAGIIAGSGTTHVFGIAPKAKIIVLKIAHQMIGVAIGPFIEALHFVCTLPEVDVVSISYSLDANPDFQAAIQKTLAAGKLIVGAIGNNRDGDFPEDPDTFPACYNSGPNQVNSNEVIAIGAFNAQKKICTFSNFNTHLSFLAPGEGIRTTQLNQSFVLEKGTSIATAFSAGCISLMLSYGKVHHKPALLSSTAMLTTCDDVGPIVGHDVKSGFGLMNLRNAVSKIKTS